MHMPSRKLLEQSQKLDKSWQHIFTASINLDQATSEAIWYSKVTEIIEKQQYTSPISIHNTTYKQAGQSFLAIQIVIHKAKRIYNIRYI